MAKCLRFDGAIKTQQALGRSPEKCAGTAAWRQLKINVENVA
jgi:hypothetical protein